jgi:hypothetical protein
MKTFALLLAATALALAACGPSNTPVAPSGGSAGAEGEAYCEKVPSNPDDLADWNQLCQPGGRR